MNNYKKYLGKIAFTTEEFEWFPKNTLVRIVGYSIKNIKYNTIIEILNQKTMMEFGHTIWPNDINRYKFIKNIDLLSSNYYYIPFRILNFLSNN